jgi:hypothetical protein
MKTLDEKKKLVAMMRALGQPIDQELVESIKREEELSKKLFGEKEKITESPLFEVVKEAFISTTLSAPAVEVPSKEEIVQQVINVLDTKKANANVSMYRDREIEGMRRTLAEMVQKINTLSWGGGGTGVVRINDTDDFDRTSYAEGRVMRWLNGMFRLDKVTGLEDFTYGAFSDTTNQTANVANTAYEIRFNTTDFSEGHYIRNNTEIVANTTGVYNYQFSMQLTSTSASLHNIWIWIRKNNTNVPNTATIISLSENKQYAVAAWNFFVDMNAGDHVHLMWATDDTRLSVAAPAATAFAPAVPSVILTVSPVKT